VPDAVNVSRLSTDDWEHAFVTGNGWQGAACYGGPLALRVTLSHERLFQPVHEPLDAPDTGRALPELRELCYAGKFQQAADEVLALATADDPRYSQLRQIDPFVGAATLTFVPHGRGGPVSRWRRRVDHASGVVRHEWSDEAGHLSQDVFASRSHNVVAVRIAASGGLSGRFHLGPIHGAPPAPQAFRNTEALSITVSFPVRWPGSVTGYDVTCRLIAYGGAVTRERGGTSVSVTDADQVLLLARTTVHSPAREYTAQQDADLGDLPANFDELLRSHVTLHRALFDRCRLELGDANEPTTTEALLKTPSPALAARLFEAGRYAIISASGDLPPNLQGVWSGTFDPAWRGGYTLDGNLPSAVSALASTGTPELLLPVFDLLDTYREDFRHNADRLYRAGGIMLPPHLSTHGRHNHFTPRWCLTFWTAGAAWASRLYYDYWRYTGDDDFLARRALPFMRAAAQFYVDFANAAGAAVTFAPSYSPENAPEGSDGSQACVNATMDAAAVRDLLRNLLDGTRALGHTDPDEPQWRRLLDRLPRYRVGADGALAEWLWPGLENNQAHRHASHLFGLWYEPDPDLLDDPALRRAAAEAIRARLRWWHDEGDEMAFGLAQLGIAAATLGLADEAHEIVSRLSTRYWRPNLVSTHNAGELFNTDICGGLPAIIVAMLVGARGDTVHLLPALPQAWPTGSIRGVLLRGGLRVDRLTWSRGLIEADLVSRQDRELTVTAPGAGAYGRIRLPLLTRADRVVRISFP
jgi:hypothetical protein